MGMAMKQGSKTSNLNSEKMSNEIKNELDVLIIQDIVSKNKLQSLPKEKTNELKSICRELISEEKRGPVLQKEYTAAKSELAALLAENKQLLAKNHTKIEELRRSADKLKEKIHHHAENVDLLISRAKTILSDKLDWDAVTFKDAMKSAVKSFLKSI